MHHLRPQLQYLIQNKSKRKPAPKTLVKSLPSRKLTAAFLKEKEDDESYTKCNICLEMYGDGESVKTLPCMHYFHLSCIDKWFSRGRTCPICKIDISKELLQGSSGSNEMTPELMQALQESH